MMKISAVTLTILAAAIACDPGSEDAFTRGRTLLFCQQNLPVCRDFFARCEMNSTTYAQVRFPDDSPFRFLVSALPHEKIEVSMYWVTPSDAGLDTQVIWYEPGCSDVYKFASDGLNLFEVSEETNIYTVSETVYEGGDHPVEIDSDMRAVVDIAVRVLVPSSG